MTTTIKVDLLPREKRAFRLDPMVLVLLFLVAGSSACFASYGQHLQQSVQGQKNVISQADEQIKQLKASLPIIEERRARVSKLQEQIRLIHSLSKDSLRYANLLRRVAGLLPPNIFLTSLSVEPTNLTVTVAGTVQEVPGRLPLATLSQLMKRLHEAHFSDANLSSASHTGNTAFSFQLQFRYDPTL